MMKIWSGRGMWVAHEELERGSGGTYDLNTLYKYMKLPKEECFYNLGKKTQSYTWSLIKSLIKFNAKLKTKQNTPSSQNFCEKGKPFLIPLVPTRRILPKCSYFLPSSWISTELVHH